MYIYIFFASAGDGGSSNTYIISKIKIVYTQIASISMWSRLPAHSGIYLPFLQLRINVRIWTIIFHGWNVYRDKFICLVFMYICVSMLTTSMQCTGALSTPSISNVSRSPEIAGSEVEVKRMSRLKVHSLTTQVNPLWIRTRYHHHPPRYQHH